MKQFCIILAIVLGLNSCTDLIDVQPENATTYTNYFQTRQDAEALLTELLLRLRNGEAAVRSGLDYRRRQPLPIHAQHGNGTHG